MVIQQPWFFWAIISYLRDFKDWLLILQRMMNSLFIKATDIIKAFILQLFFDFLAFKNDIHFWKTRKNLEGLSPRTIIWRATSQIIIFLFLVDEGTSLLVVVPAFVGVLIEVSISLILHLGWNPSDLKFIFNHSYGKFRKWFQLTGDNSNLNQ